MKLIARIIIGLVLMNCISWISLHADEATNHSDRILLNADLDRLLQDIAPWPDGETTYSDRSWRSLISAAKYIQGCDPASVESTLIEYEHKTYVDKASPPPNSGVDYYKNAGLPQYVKRLEDDSRLLLLMRMVFNLPDHNPSNGIQYFGWKSFAERKDGTTDLNWPIRWENDLPVLASGMTGMQGVVDVYNVVGEYKYFSKKYHFRSLDHIQLKEIAH